MLLKENAYLKMALTALLPGGNGLPQTEIAFLQAMVGNNEMNNSNGEVMTGNNAANISYHQLMKGNNGLINSNNKVIIGNNAMNVSSGDLMIGNNHLNNSNDDLQEGINEQQLAIVQANVSVLMKNAILRSHLTTSKILVQLSINPATPLSDLRTLAGMTEDGMAKRIMAMKKAGLITRVSAPKRYLLTEKAKALFIENKRY